MTPVQHLVNRIGEFVHGFSQQATPASQEMARQFAEACRAFNDRLLKCLDYLCKGMRSEAVQEAGASGLRDMGKCMAVLKERYAGRMDFSRASGIVREMLS